MAAKISIFLFCPLVLLTFFMIATANVPESDIKASTLNENTDEKLKELHRIDSLNVLIFLLLLILIVLTIWLFKHRRFRFVHETGLGIIYGLVVGIIIRYASSTPANKYPEFSLPAHSNSSDYSASNPPDSIHLNFNNSNGPVYAYNFKGVVPVDSDSEDTEIEDRATFNPEVFFNFLLPPIIFHAGYSMKRRHFFRNFGAVVTFAFVGTAISCFVVGGILYGFTRLMIQYSSNWINWKMQDFGFKDCLFFGALISATDPVTVLAIFHDLNVDVDLYALVFGESVLNDAVAIVLSGAVENYHPKEGSGDFDWKAVLISLGNFVAVFAGSFAIGSLMGCITALLTKFTKIRDYPLLETALFFLMSYSTFLAAEAADLTGIVAVLFCGICQAHYTYNNLSAESKARTKQMFELLNFLAENFVFMYIGVSTFTFTRHRWDAPFIFAAFFAIIIGRACNIYPLAFLLNLGRKNKIKVNFMHLMMFSGLRGAIAFALAIRNTLSHGKELVFTTTLLIVIATVILCGGFTTQMLQWLKIRVGVEDETADQQQPVRLALQRQRQYSTMDENSQPQGTTPTSPQTPQSLQSPDFEIHPSRQPEPAPAVHVPEAEKAWLVNKWYKFDQRIMKPFLTHARPPLTETCSGRCLPLAKLLTTTEQLQGGEFTNEDSDDDMIIDENDLHFDSASGNSTGVNSQRKATLQVEDPDESHAENNSATESRPESSPGEGLEDDSPLLEVV